MLRRKEPAPFCSLWRIVRFFHFTGYVFYSQSSKWSGVQGHLAHWTFVSWYSRIWIFTLCCLHLQLLFLLFYNSLDFVAFIFKKVKFDRVCPKDSGCKLILVGANDVLHWLIYGKVLEYRCVSCNTILRR